MLRKRINIAIILLIGLISIQSGYVFAEQPKGSRLNIKPVAVKKKALSFTKGKSVIGFKASEGNFDLKPANTVKLYFTNYLTSRNLSKPTVKEQQVSKPVVASEVAYTSNKVTSTSEEEAEPGERFFTVEGLTISNIYPNPADDAGNFDYLFSGNNYKEVKIDFFNVLGSPMNVSVALEKFDRKARVSLKEFPNGFYFYQLIADGKTLATKKLLVRHYN
jgi:Secretion system C-terminal sorting domain